MCIRDSDHSEKKLGSELVTASVSTGSGITSSSYITYDDGKMNINASGQDFYIIINTNADTSSQSLRYRLVVTVDSYTSGGMSMAGGSAGFNAFTINDSFNDIIVPDSNGGDLQLRVINYVGIISSISLKRITSSPNLSDTYPAIIDVNEPVLGVELFGDPSFENASYWAIYGGNGGVDVNTTTAGKLTVVNAQDTRLQKNLSLIHI